jgi:tetratricopeptide (TPR) repeat protein
MSLFDRILRRFLARPPLRPIVEEAFGRDDGNALVAALKGRREEGKVLIREYERELGEAPDSATRERLARTITALVAVYAKAFGDREPLEWFRREGDNPELAAATQHLEEAKRLVAEGGYADAEGRVKSGLRVIADSPDPESAEAVSLASALLGVAGGAALRADDVDRAREKFEESLAKARVADKAPYLAAALFNLIDLHTRGSTFADADAIFAEAETVVQQTNDASLTPQYENVLGKLAIERGVSAIRGGDLERAVSSLDLAVRVRPEWPFPYYQRAWARFLGGDSGGAADDYRDCALRKHVFFTVQRELRCLEDVAAGLLPLDAYRSYCAIRDEVRTEPDLVEESAGRMIDRVPGFAPAHALLAEARLTQGHSTGALEAAEAALLLDPDEDTAAASLFIKWLVSHREGDMEAADLAADRLKTAYPEQPASLLVQKARESPQTEQAFRWTWAFDGTLRFEEVEPNPPPGRTDPPPESRG